MVGDSPDFITLVYLKKVKQFKSHHLFNIKFDLKQIKSPH